MPQNDRTYYSFLGGEVSKNLFNRIDMQQNSKWFETAENIFFDTTGGFSNRHGFRRIGLAANDGYDSKIKLIPFTFNNKQSYCIEFGNTYFRIIKNGMFVKNSEGNEIKIEHNINMENVDKISYCQIADILYIALGGNKRVKCIKRYSETNWAIDDFDYEIPPMQSFNTDKNKTITFTSDSTSSSEYYYDLKLPAPTLYNYISDVSFKIYNSVTSSWEEIFNGQGQYTIPGLISAFNSQQTGEHEISASLLGSENIARFKIQPIASNTDTGIEGGAIKYTRMSVSANDAIYKREEKKASIPPSPSQGSTSRTSGSVTLPSGCKVTIVRYQYGDTVQNNSKLVTSTVFQKTSTASPLSPEEAMSMLYEESQVVGNSSYRNKISYNQTTRTISCEMICNYTTSGKKYFGYAGVYFQYYIPTSYSMQSDLTTVSTSETETGIFFSESNFDFFSDKEIGEIFAVKSIYSPSLTGETGQNKTYYNGDVGNGETITPAFWSNGSWRIVTSGLFTGSIEMQYSYDGDTWYTHRTFSSTIRETKGIKYGMQYNEYGNIDVDDNILLRLKINVTAHDSNCITFDTNSFENIGYFKILEKDSTNPNKKAKIQCIKYSIGTPKTTYQWADPSWSNSNGYPKVVFAYQNRLGFACTRNEPQTIWFSKTDEFKKFDVMAKIKDTDAITISALKPKGISEIVNVSSIKKLFIFTSDYEFAIRDEGELTQKNKQLISFTAYGSEAVETQLISNRILFIEKGGTAARELMYNFAEENYEARDVTIFFKHLINSNNRIIATSFVGGEYKTYLMLTEDGTIICYKYIPEQEIAACSKFKHAVGHIIDLICIYNENKTHDIYALVEINGIKYLEFLRTGESDWGYMDCLESFKYQEPVSTVYTKYESGINIDIIKEDGTIVKKTIGQNGTINLGEAMNNFAIGFPVKAEATLIPPSVLTRTGSTIYNKKNLFKCHVTFDSSYGFQIGIKGKDKFKTIYNISKNEVIDNEEMFSSGKKDVIISSSYNDENMISFVQDKPFKMYITNVEIEVDYGGK